ncbi:Pentatricopeptide repeat-containing protein, mitochondrial [Glycine max]|nr:Pentatricopeptide repeat-containing protein, mitochondrial [Glycine max]
MRVHNMFDKFETFPGAEKVHAILSWLCNGKKAKEAHEVYVVATEKGKLPLVNVVSFLVLKLCGEDETVKSALEILEYIPEEKTYSKAGEMGKAVEMTRWKRLRRSWQKKKKKHVKLGSVMFHTLIRGYCKLEQFDEALKLLGEMKDYGVRPSVDEANNVYATVVMLSASTTSFSISLTALIKPS